MTKRDRLGIRIGYSLVAVAMGILLLASRAVAGEDQGLREGSFKARISADEYFIVKLVTDKQGDIKVQRVKYSLPDMLAGGIAADRRRVYRPEATPHISDNAALPRRGWPVARWPISFVRIYGKRGVA